MKNYLSSIVLLLSVLSAAAQSIQITDAGSHITVTRGDVVRLLPKKEVSTTYTNPSLYLNFRFEPIFEITSNTTVTVPTSSSMTDLRSKLTAIIADTVSSGGITTETDPTVNADIKTITATDITNWRALPGNVVLTSGNQTNILGNKTWAGLHVFSQFVTVPGINTGLFNRNTASSPFSFQQTSSATTIAYLHATTGDAVFQAPGAVPTDNGNRLTVDGSSLFNGTATFTGTWANRQASFGSTGQGGLIQFNRGTDGTSQMRIGYTAAAGSAAEIFAASSLSVVSASAGALNITASSGTGSVSFQAGGVNSTRMTISSTGIVNIQNTPVYADNAAAVTGGLLVGDVYRTTTGQLMIRY